MAVRKKENGSLTGSKRYKEEKAKSAGAKAKEIAESVGAKLVDNAPKVVSTVASAVVVGASQAKQAGTDVKQVLGAIAGYEGYKGSYASSDLTTSSDAYGGLALPQVDFKSMVPTDLLNPEGLPECSEEQLTAGLSKYASAKRAMELYQAGFSYISEIGKAKLQMHKAQGSVVKAATEEVKVKQEITKFDIENVNLASTQEKLSQANEGLKQEQIKSLAAQNETEQLRQKMEALEGKRTAEIDRIKSQTQNIIQKYLKDSIASVA